jgi:hypothetical protein
MRKMCSKCKAGAAAASSRFKKIESAAGKSAAGKQGSTFMLDQLAAAGMRMAVAAGQAQDHPPHCHATHTNGLVLAA